MDPQGNAEQNKRRYNSENKPCTAGVNEKGIQPGGYRLYVVRIRDRIGYIGSAMKPKELRDLLISTLLLAVAFGIALSGGVQAFSELGSLLIVCLMAVVSVSLGFILHEMGHRFIARKFGCIAEYRMWPAGLIIALVSSLFGFVFAAPGAVMISSGTDSQGRTTLTQEKAGLISIAGPLMTISLAVVFILLNVAWPTLLFSLGAYINAWLAAFNLIPFGPLDGAAVFRWNKMVWVAVAAVAVALFALELFVL